MEYKAIAIANAFIEQANNGRINNLTPMKLQKLMFFAQSWYLKHTGMPLFEGSFERWQYGPVLPEIYHEFKRFGSSNIDNFGYDMWKNRQTIDYYDSEVINFLDQIISIYGIYSGTELSWMTHQLGTAWSNGTLGTIINSNDMINGKV